MARLREKSIAQIVAQRERILQAERQRYANRMGRDVSTLPTRNITTRMERASNIAQRYLDNIRRTEKYQNAQHRVQTAEAIMRGRKRSVFAPSAERDAVVQAINDRQNAQYSRSTYMGASTASKGMGGRG